MYSPAANKLCAWVSAKSTNSDLIVAWCNQEDGNFCWELERQYPNPLKLHFGMEVKKERLVDFEVIQMQMLM